MIQDWMYYSAVFSGAGLALVMLFWGVHIGQNRVYEQLEKQGVKVTRGNKGKQA